MTPPTKGRLVGFLEAERKDDGTLVLPDLHCPYGHKIPWEFALHEAGYPRCLEENSAGHRVCNARLFVHFAPRINQKAGVMLFVAEISYDEIKYVTDRGFDVPQIMAHLGLSWAPLSWRTAA